jgi:peptidoglycan L-alanyl-D-glutamate endopeptidase CwlK
MTYDRDPKYMHPLLKLALDDILQAIGEKLPNGFSCKMLSAYREPKDQIELFKKGREFKGGVWKVVDKSKIVTYKDGYVNLSRHNYLPCTAIDIGIFDGTGKYLGETSAYKYVERGKTFGFDWGGDWKTFKDLPHLEIPTAVFFQKNIEKDNGLIWQNYLQKAGTYHGVLDGLFGPKSIEALKAATGQSERNRQAWDNLFEAHGEPEPPVAKESKLEMNALVLGALNIDRPTPNPGPRPRPNPGQRPGPKTRPGERPHP